MVDSCPTGAAIATRRRPEAVLVNDVSDVISRWRKQRLPFHPLQSKDLNPNTFSRKATLHNTAFHIAETFGEKEAQRAAGPLGPQQVIIQNVPTINDNFYFRDPDTGQMSVPDVLCYS
jgi:hypothetical protein